MRTISSHDCTFIRFSCSCAPPTPVKWPWLSMKPGIASCPWRSITFVFGPIIGVISAAVPSAMILSPLTASASTSGRASSTVTMWPLVSTRSAGGACAVPPRCARAWTDSAVTKTANAIRWRALFRIAGDYSGSVTAKAGAPPRSSQGNTQITKETLSVFVIFVTLCGLRAGASARFSRSLLRKQPVEVAAEDQRAVGRGESGGGALLLLVDRRVPSAREERRVGAEEQPRGASHGQRRAEDAIQREVVAIAHPRVRAGGVEMDRRALVRRHQRLAEAAGAEVRNDDRHLRKAQRDPRYRERIAEAEVEAARQPELLPDAHAQEAAVHEHRGAVRCRRAKHRFDALV